MADHGIENEPFYSDEAHSPDSVADEPALTGSAGALSDAEEAQQNVWDEPSSRAAGIAPPPEARTYAHWYRERLAGTPAETAWLVTLLLAAVSGPFALFGVFAKGFTQGHALGIVLFGPALEEMMKVGLLLILLENRPYLFRSSFQLLAVALASALAFAAIENVMYIHLYVKEPTAFFIAWRWTVCTGVHSLSSCVAGLGLVRMWRAAQPDPSAPPRSPESDYSMPHSRNAFPLLVGAVALHGGYNTIAIFLEHWLPFT